MLSDPAVPLSDAALLQEAMLFYHVEQRHRMQGHGPLSLNRMLLLLARKGALSQADLVRIMGLEKSWVSRAADKLVAQGWITKTSKTDDRRGLLLSLTEAGRHQADALEATLDAHAHSVLARLDDTARDTVMQAMRVLHRALAPRLSGAQPAGDSEPSRGATRA